MSIYRSSLNSHPHFLCYVPFQVAMRALGFDVKKAHVQELMRSYDKQNTGFITQNDFEEISAPPLISAFPFQAILG